MIRPPLIALEPGVYWSMVYHYNLNVDPNHPLCSAEGMLRLAMPTLDMSHLDRGGRKRVLSEKAKENERQQKEQKSSGGEEEIPSVSQGWAWERWI